MICLGITSGLFLTLYFPHYECKEFLHVVFGAVYHVKCCVVLVVDGSFPQNPEEVLTASDCLIV